TTLFLRDDDAGALTPELVQFAAVFESAGLPVSYQIIPDKLTDECAAWIRARKAAAPDLYEFGQHGMTHHTMVDGVLKNHEFGPERDYRDQLALIEQGRDILDAKVGDAWERTLFTPPQHKFTRDTLRALAASGYAVLSGASYTDPIRRAAYVIGRLLGLTTLKGGGVSWHGRTRPEAPLTEISIGVAVDEGSPLERDLDAVMADIARARTQTPWVGLMFHHQAWPGEAKRAWLEALAARLKTLDGVRFSAIAPIARAIEAA
ncbi:MAG TPA: DUF2334 domain-containing protein, partial [Sphingomonas sp.]|nr:DUF2334 domain-containing protein [Sphingomonas sp.]